jgi:hypothetical protein
VALHHAGGNLVKNQRGDRMYANEGILVSKIWTGERVRRSRLWPSETPRRGWTRFCRGWVLERLYTRGLEGGRPLGDAPGPDAITAGGVSGTF